MGARKSLFAAVLAGALATAVSASAKDYKIGYSVFWGTNPFLVTALSDKKPAARSAVVASVYEQPVSIFQQLT